jgi:hypothetical protein
MYVHTFRKPLQDLEELESEARQQERAKASQITNVDSINRTSILYPLSPALKPEAPRTDPVTISGDMRRCVICDRAVQRRNIKRHLRQHAFCASCNCYIATDVHKCAVIRWEWTAAMIGDGQIGYFPILITKDPPPPIHDRIYVPPYFQNATGGRSLTRVEYDGPLANARKM